MRKTFVIIIGIVLLFAFSDTRQNSFSQQMKVRSVRSTYTKPLPVNKDSIKLAEKLDSLSIEGERSEGLLEERKEIIKTQLQVKDKLTDLNWLVYQTLQDLKKMKFDSTRPREDSLQAIMRQFPDLSEIKPEVKQPEFKVRPDTIIIKIEKKSAFQKLLFWKK